MPIPHISKLLADCSSYIADSCCCFLSRMAQGLMCFLVTGNKNRTEIVTSINKERLESLQLISLKVPSTEMLINIVTVAQNKHGWGCPFLHSFLFAGFSRAILNLAILSFSLADIIPQMGQRMLVKSRMQWFVEYLLDTTSVYRKSYLRQVSILSADTDLLAKSAVWSTERNQEKYNSALSSIYILGTFNRYTSKWFCDI